MSALDNLPENKNFLSPFGFQFQVKKLPHVNFFVQKVNIPGINLNPPQQPNPFVTIPKGGDHIMYDELQVVFKVDERMETWKELYNWIKGIGFPNRFEEHRELAQKSIISQEGLYSDISLLVLTSSRNPIFDIVFRDAHPTALSSITFDSTNPSLQYLTATVTFRYISYSINDV